MPRRVWTYFTAVCLVCGIVSTGCERTPEDVERWRNAKRMNEKMTKWLKSPNEPMDVRIRALEILIETYNPSLIEETLEEIDDEKQLAPIVQAGADKIQTMWEKKDYPTMEDRDEKGRVKVSDSASIKAKDAAYYLQPFAKGDNKSKLEAILAEWLSKEWGLRNKLGKTTLGQLLPRAGSKGVDNVLEWLEQTDELAKVAGILRRKAGEKAKGKVAEILLSRADKQHPDLSSSLQAAILQTRHDKVVPYLKKVVSTPDEGSTEFNVKAFQALINIQGERVAPFMTDLIQEHGGTFRWEVVTELIKLRGKSGLLSAMSALPLDDETYGYPDDPNKNFKGDAKYFATFALNQMIKSDVSTLSSTLIRAVESERWPAHVMALMCVQRAIECAGDPAACGESDKAKKTRETFLDKDRESLRQAIEALTDHDKRLPAWGDGYKTVGQLARETADELSSS